MIYRLRQFVLIFLLLTGCRIAAQAQYSISGTVLDEKGEPAKSATVFISGTQKITATNEEGKFSFGGMQPGTFQLSVQMIGYAPFAQNVLVQTKSIDLKIALTIKATALREVVIGNGSSWDKHYKIFVDKFIGSSKNAKDCVIMNPKVIDFSTNRNVLKADADEFLIIENNRLGYRIRYQLKSFEFDGRATSYDGETNFEEMTGTDKQKAQWAKNRLEAYNGSMMHFLRAVYHKNTQEQGFVTRQLYTSPNSSTPLMNPEPVDFSKLVTPIDTSFVSLKFGMMYMIYNPKQAADDKTGAFKLADKGSVLKLYLPEAIIDARGADTDYRTFQVEGKWAKDRIGDQLPFEYQPPAKVE